VRDALHVFQLLFDPFHLKSRLIDAHPLREPEIYKKLWAGRVREKALFDKSESKKRCCETSDNHGHGHPAETDTDRENTSVDLVKFAIIGIRCFFSIAFIYRFAFQKGLAKQRCAGDRRHPAQHQRYENHPEQGCTILSCTIRRCTDRSEGGNRHDGGTEKWNRGLPNDIPGSTERTLPLLHFDPHAVGDHNGVVHQHTECDDQCSQRYSLKGNITHGHKDKSAHDRDQQHGTDNQSAAEPHKQKQHHHDNDDGLRQVYQKPLDG